MTDVIIPSNPADLKKIKDVVAEITNSMVRVESEKEYQKEAVADLSEQFTIDKKFIRKMAVDSFKDQFEKNADEFDSYSTLYEKVMSQ